MLFLFPSSLPFQGFLCLYVVFMKFVPSFAIPLQLLWLGSLLAFGNHFVFLLCTFHSLPRVIIRPVLNTYLSHCEPYKDRSSDLSIISQCHHPPHTRKHIYSHTLTHPHSPTHTHSSAYLQKRRLICTCFHPQTHCIALHLRRKHSIWA